jgi:hypothetical protein
MFLDIAHYLGVHFLGVGASHHETDSAVGDLYVLFVESVDESGVECVLEFGEVFGEIFVV